MTSSPPSEALVVLAARMSGWPPVRLGCLPVEGEAAWRDVARRCTPIERGWLRDALGAAFPSWLVPELVATPAAQERLLSWSFAGSIEPSPDDLVRRLRFLGDEEGRHLVLRAMHERIPPPVTAFLLDSVLFGAVGWSACGWCIRTAMPPGPILTTILISGAPREPAAILDVVLHECAHAWLLPNPAAPVAPEAMFNEVGAALLAAAKRPDFMRDIVAAEARDEAAADALARTWGGRLSCSDARAAAYTGALAASLTRTHESR